MNYLEFKTKLEEKNYPLFETKELRLIFKDQFNKSLINNIKRWEKKGFLIKLRKGLYLLKSSHFSISAEFLASKIYVPSYISLETALSHHGIIPEAVYTITSVTSRKTKQIENELGIYKFQSIKKEAFGGFQIIQKKELGISYNLALPEKALVDFLYFNRQLLTGEKEQFKSFRFNEDFNYKKRRLKKYAQKLTNEKVRILIDKFIKYYVAG